MPTTLIEPEELLPHLEDADWAIVDCRFDLADPDWGERAWRMAHIPHALYAHLDRDLSGALTSASGRHPLPTVAALARTFSRFGIDRAVQVVAYDQLAGSFAARLWWLLRWLGHREVAVLNGGFAAWERAGLPVSGAPGARAGRQFVPAVQAGMLADTLEIERALGSGALARAAPLLIDARSAERFAGREETIDTVAGHIPGARNHPSARNHDAQGRFLPSTQLRSLWEATLAGQSAAAVISMCGSGVTACDNLLALELLGLKGARLYAGSWSEWIRDPQRAIARGLGSV